jgi:hypothetical protein
LSGVGRVRHLKNLNVLEASGSKCDALSLWQEGKTRKSDARIRELMAKWHRLHVHVSCVTQSSHLEASRVGHGIVTYLVLSVTKLVTLPSLVELVANGKDAINVLCSESYHLLHNKIMPTHCRILKTAVRGAHIYFGGLSHDKVIALSSPPASKQFGSCPSSKTFYTAPLPTTTQVHH